MLYLDRWILLAAAAACFASCERSGPGSHALSHGFHDSEVSIEVEIADMFADAVLFFDRHLRDPVTGFYFDRVSLRGKTKPEPSENVSSAAIGMGLIALALGDAAGIVQDAHQKAKQTFASIQSLEGSAVRSPTGWYLHWFRPNRTLSEMSVADGYSTIDTAILVIGATMAAEYFKNRYNDPTLASMAAEFARTIHWDDAIRDEQTGGLVLNFPLSHPGVKLGTALPFNEYAIIPCFARNLSAGMRRVWSQHFASPAGLPTKLYRGYPQLTDNVESHISHFTIQLAYYLCPDFRESADYQDFFQHAYRADRVWAQAIAPGSRLFGLGAGSGFTFVGSTAYDTYSADSLSFNPAFMVSPTVMSGFIPMDPVQITTELVQLRREKTCLYEVEELQVLWRCSFRDLHLQVEGIESIDFSKMVLGLGFSAIGIL